MIYTGIDYHNRYSVACTLDAQGRKLKEARIEANAPKPSRTTSPPSEKPVK